MTAFSLSPVSGFPAQLPPFALEPLGYQQLTAITVATGLTVPPGATIAVVIAEGQDIRWRDDSVDPTATVGMLLPWGQEKVFFAGLSNLKFIAISDSPILNVSYY